MIWLRKKGAAHSATFQNVHDAAILWFLREPRQVDATVVRQGTIAQISTTDVHSIERAREFVEESPHWVPVVCEAKWEKFVNLERITDAVLEDDPPPGEVRGVRKLVLSVAYIAPDKPYQPQSYACGEIQDRHLIRRVLEQLGHAHPEEEERELVVEIEQPAPRAKRRARV